MSIRAALVDDMLTQLSITSLIDQRIFDDFFEFEDFLNQKANKNQFPAISVETSGDELEEKLTGHNQLDTASLIITCYNQVHIGKMRSRSASVKAKQKTLLRKVDAVSAAVKTYLNDLMGETISGLYIRHSHVNSITDGDFENEDNRRIITRELSFSVMYS